MKILAFDTAMAACSAAVIDTDLAHPLAQVFVPMERGHAEALAPMVVQVMKEAGLAFSRTGPDCGNDRARNLHRCADRTGAGTRNWPCPQHTGYWYRHAASYCRKRWFRISPSRRRGCAQRRSLCGALRPGAQGDLAASCRGSGSRAGRSSRRHAFDRNRSSSRHRWQRAERPCLVRREAISRSQPASPISPQPRQRGRCPRRSISAHLMRSRKPLRSANSAL